MNQGTFGVTLNLSMVCNHDRNLISVLEACLPNLNCVGTLMLKDNSKCSAFAQKIFFLQSEKNECRGGGEITGYYMECFMEGITPVFGLKSTRHNFKLKFVIQISES